MGPRGSAMWQWVQREQPFKCKDFQHTWGSSRVLGEGLSNWQFILRPSKQSLLTPSWKEGGGEPLRAPTDRQAELYSSAQLCSSQSAACLEKWFLPILAKWYWTVAISNAALLWGHRLKGQWDCPRAFPPLVRRHNGASVCVWLNYISVLPEKRLDRKSQTASFAPGVMLLQLICYDFYLL